MDESAIIDAYTLFQRDGYDDSLEDFKELMQTSEEAVNDAYKLFVKDGYEDTILDFVELMGVKQEKKNPVPTTSSVQAAMESDTTQAPAPPISSESSAPTSPDEEVEETTVTEEGSDTEGLDESLLIQPQSFNFTNEEGEKTTRPGVGFDFTEGIVESEVDNTDFFTQSLQQVNADLISSNEEEVIPLMQYHFRDYGFTFEPADDLGDGMYVYAKGVEEPLYVNLDRWWSKESTAKTLSQFLQANRIESKKLYQIEQGYIKSKQKLQDKDQVKKTIQAFTQETDGQKKNIEQYLGLKMFYDENNLSELDPNEIFTMQDPTDKDKKITTTPLQLKAKILAQEAAITLENERLSLRGQELDKAIGEWSEMTADQGSWSSALWNGLMDGIAGQDAGKLNLLTDLMVEGFFALDMAMDPVEYRKRVMTLAKESGVLGDTYTKERISEIAKDPEKYKEIEEVIKKAPGPIKKVTNPLITVDGVPQVIEEKTSLLAEIRSKIIDEEKKRQKYDVAPGDEVYRNPYSQFANDPKYDKRQGLLEMQREGLRTTAGVRGTTQEFDEKVEKGFWGGAILGVTRSIPAMIGPVPIRTFNMVMQAENYLIKEMENNPNFKDVTENERAAFAVPLAAVVGVLENYGFRNVLNQKGFANTILLKVLGKTGVNTSGKAFNEVVKKEVNSLMAKGALVLTAGGLAEFETGLMQEVADIGAKKVYNSWKAKAIETDGNDMFVGLPEEFMSTETVQRVLRAGAQEAVGGFIIGTPGAISAAASRGDFTQLAPGVFEMFEEMHNEPIVKSAFITRVKEKVLNGDISKQAGENMINSYDQVVGVMNKIPANLPTKQKKEFLGNLLRQQELNDYIDKYDKQLTKKQQQELLDLENDIERIVREGDIQNQQDARETELNTQAINELKEEGIENPTPEQIKTKRDAIQKSSPKKVDVQESTEGSQEVGDGDTQGQPTQESQENQNDPDSQTQEEVEDLTSIFNEQTGVQEETETETEQPAGKSVEVDSENNNVTIEKSDGTKVTIPGFSVSENVTVTENAGAPKIISSLLRQAENAGKAMLKLIPNLDIVVHATEDLYNQAVSEGNTGKKGAFDLNTNTIHINASKADTRTVAHEVMHAVLLKKLGIDSKRYSAVTGRMLQSVIKGLPKNSNLKEVIEDFAKDYAVEEQNEEKVAELFGYLAAAYTQLDGPTKNIVKRWLQKVAKAVGLPVNITQYTQEETDMIDFFNIVSKKVREGTEVTEGDIEVIDKVKTPKKKSKKETKKAEPKETKSKETKKTEPKEKAQKAPVERLAKMYEMKKSGVIFNKPGVNRAALEDWANSLGFRVETTRGDIGELTGFKLIRPDGRVYKPTKEKAQRSVNEKAQKTFNKFDTPLQIINKARELNFTDPAILDYLTRVRKFTKTEVRELMKVNADLLNIIPPGMGNVKGGMKAGIKLFKKVSNHYNKLLKKNAKAKNKLSPQEIMDQAMDFLRAQPEYKKLAADGALSTEQTILEIDVARALGGKQSSDLISSIRNARIILKSKVKGQKDLRKIQRELRNFMRKTLPSDLYTKAQALALMKKIQDANKDNIQQIMDEVMEFAAEKNNARLEKAIEALLDPKNTTKNISNTLRGVKIDEGTRKRLASIKRRIDAANKTKDSKTGETRVSTLEDVVKYLETLEAEYEEINAKPLKTEGDYTAMADLNIIMNMVNANKLMGNKDISKVSTLAGVELELKQVITAGRTLLKEQLRKAHVEYRRQFQQVYEDVTGREESFEDQAKRELKEEGISKPTEAEIFDKITDIIEDLKDTLKTREREPAGTSKKKITVKERFKKLGNDIVKSLGNIMGMNSDVFLLMDKISLLPAELFEGKTQEEITKRIDAANREMKGRMLVNDALIISKFQELFGKKYKSIVTSFGRKTEAFELPDGTEMVLSPNEMYYLYNQYKDQSNHPGLENTFSTDSDGLVKVMNEITTRLESEQYKNLKEFADWQVDVLYPMLYNYYNQAYQDIYRTQMPYNVNYAGMVYRDGMEAEGVRLIPGLDKQKPNVTTVVTANSTKMRQDNKNAIKPTDGTNALYTYMRDMEYFSAYARPINDINKLFTNKLIKSEIVKLHGKSTMDAINIAIQKIANKGTSKGDIQMDNAVDIMQDMFILSRLGINPVVTLKQLTSFLTYASDIGYVNWMKNAALSRFGKGQDVKSVWKEIAENSTYLQDRDAKSMTKAIEMYSDKAMESVFPDITIKGRRIMSGANKESLVNILMYTTKVGDRGAIYLGGVPNYVYYKNEFKKNNPNATEQEAIDYAIIKFERDTKRSQQSTDLQDRDAYQTKGPIFRALNMFLTTPRQYLRKEVYALRNMYRLVSSGGKSGKGTKTDAARIFLTYHVVMPVFFQYVANGMPGLLADWDDEDTEDLAWASILGNINALFLYGDLAVMIKNMFSDKPESFIAADSLPILTQGAETAKKFLRYRKIKDPKKKQEALYAALAEAAQYTGLPINNLRKIFKNMDELIDGGEDPAKVIMRLFNYSEYQIMNEAERKNARRTKRKTLKKVKKEVEDNTIFKEDKKDDNAVFQKGKKNDNAIFNTGKKNDNKIF